MCMLTSLFIDKIYCCIVGRLEYAIDFFVKSTDALVAKNLMEKEDTGL